MGRMLLDQIKVVIGTTNPAKRAAVATVLDKLFPSGSQLLAVSVPSGVSAQPFDVHETRRHDQHRLAGVGLEGGLELIGERYFECGWICVADREGRLGWGSSARFELSAKLVAMLKEGKELADVIDEVSGKSDVRSNEGAMGIVTNLSRAEAYSHGVWFAFAPFISPLKYWE
ncbi:NTPase [Acanthamoeba castellanii str. Neff]|uniref:inosine/xanthosine triphosphatase n=1 Tax=Acanthamoeba castellanii (strain ATCC 30010 / Neff) TaxID=1257118 RepID=L8HHH2_ACACF|nr:NTPase [Acanthamoeba castellanii str. Neff]ELR25034.1 NTPase [Acanthamoeba castellanii str. Neff]